MEFFGILRCAQDDSRISNYNYNYNYNDNDNGNYNGNGNGNGNGKCRCKYIGECGDSLLGSE